ncbi:MAG: hydrogenase iron-sulfur subunit [Proteobacteria bacterium]|nr:hydrogenase iron-sulfur subunit [Pseudomonadota bacterium]
MTANQQPTKRNEQPAPSPRFEPELTAFTCSYCAYMSGDTAGAMRLQYPANVKVVKLPCTGKTDARYLLSAFEEGADGVYVIACPIGNCHHVRGNERARARVDRTKKLLDQVGLGGGRLDIFFLSGGMGESFAVAAREMTERIRKLGPNPLRNGGRRESEKAGRLER